MKSYSNNKFVKIVYFSIMFILLTFVNFNLVSATEVVNSTYSDSSFIQVTSLKYDPSPVNPNEYFDIWINVKFLRNPRTDVQFELLQTYPFSLDPNESAVKTYSTPVSSSILLSYKVRVDKDAIEGTNKLTLVYSFEGTSYTTDFNIDVQNSQTNFDAVIQETSGSDVSIAIANIGKYTANSVVVRIPEQDSFTVTGTDGQMVGNLESGDYTIVGFTVSPKISASTSKDSLPNLPSSQTTPSELKFDIYYTDNIGERRVVSMELPLKMTVNNSAIMGGNFPRGTRSSWSIWYTLAIILAVFLITGFILAKKYPKVSKNIKEKIINLFKKKKVENKNSSIPAWMNNVKGNGKIK
jgi:hypothetical protein